MKKKKNLTRPVAMAMAVSLAFGSIPYNVMANGALEVAEQKIFQKVGQGNPGAQKPADALSSATYYKKANWENKIKDKSRWKVEDTQRLVRVSTSDPVQMNDIDYDGMFIDANGRYVIRLVYKEKSQAASVVWYRALINFGDLEKLIDFDQSYVLGKDGKTQYKFEDVNNVAGKGFDLGKAAGDRTTNRKNLPINLVLNEGVDISTLGNMNYIVQMRLTDGNYKRVYAYAPKGTSMDYSTYTKTTAVDLVDKLGTLFIKGGYQKDGKNATNQEFFMSEFIANPDQYSDSSNLGIIRTQYMGQATTIVRATVGEQPFAFTQVFDANLVKYMKADDAGNVAYVNVLTNVRELSPYTKNVGIPKDKINYSTDGKIAYIVIGTKDFKKDGVKVVNVEKNDQHTMLSGFYITAIDYVVDKSIFENTFKEENVRKLNYTTMSGWTNPNTEGWTIFEKDYDDKYVVPEGESYLIDTTEPPTGGQIMIQVGGEQAILRKPQGYYNGYVSDDGANDAIEEFAKGVYKFTLREGATILPGKKLRVYMPYTESHEHPVNFLEIHNGTKLNEGAATLKLLANRKINMHLYKEDKKGHFVLKYTLANGTETSKKFEPKITWKYDNKDKVMTGASNGATLSTGGNFYIDTEKLQPGADIFVESYDENGKKLEDQTSWFKYKPLTKANDNVKNLTWTDHSDKKAVLSVNKSLYTPYQVLFTNDYAEGTDDFYKDPRVLPTSNDDFKKDTTEFVGYTKYDGGKVITIYDEGRTPKLIAKVQADEDEYNDKGELTKESAKKIIIPKEEIFDPNFNETSKEYTAYEYKVNLAKMLEYNSADKTDKSLTLLKDMKFVSNASDGSSLPSDLYETRVRARVLFDTTDGEFADKTKKAVKIVPDNIKFYGEDGYTANGFEGDNVEANTGDKFPQAPTLAGKNFLGWVTEDAKNKLGKTTVTAEEFNALTKDEIFSEDTPVTKHLVVYAIYSADVTVTLDANGGKFDDGKEEHTAKAVDGTVTVAKEPTKEGYKFKGWAATKDAETADDTILTGVTAPKTVYAVWEKNDKEPLQLNNPTPVEVKDIKALTSDEINKVKKAVVEANKDKGITEADVTVAEDGAVTVTKDGKTGTLTPDKTIKQKEVQNEFNPPKEPVKVDKIGELKPDEIAAIKQAVKDANPDRNFKDDEITVKPDGTVEINQGGKVGTIPAEKTVVQKDTILGLQAPEKTEVKDITNLTKEERAKVAEAVKQKNNLPDTATIDVDSKGNVTVKTTDGKTGTLKAEETVKPFTREGKTLNPPANKVKVSNKDQLTEQEKQAVRDEIKKANPELGFTDDEIQVDPNGTVTVPMGKSEASIPGTETVEEATDADKTIKLAAPEKVLVADKTKLTLEEKSAVKDAVKAANQALNLQDDEIEVAEDGSVTVTRGEGEDQKVGQLAQADTVIEKLKKPEAKALSDGSVVVTPKDDRTEELDITFGTTTITAKKENGKWILPKGTDPSIKIDEERGLVTIPAKMLKNKEEVKAKAKAAKLESEEATVSSKDGEAPAAPEVKAEDDGSVKVTPPTDADTKSVTIAYKDQAGNLQTLTATKGDDGNWTLPAGTDASIKIDQTTGVVTLPKDKIKVGEKVTASAKDANDNESSVGEATPVDKEDLKAEVAKEDATKNDVKYTNADKAKQEAYDAALAKAKKVLEDPNTKQKDVNEALQQLKEAEAALDGTAKPADELNDPAKVAVKDKTNLSADEIKAVKDAVIKANPGLIEEQIQVDKEGNVKVTKPGETPKTIDKEKTVSTTINVPELTEVANKANLDETEKGNVKKAVIAANNGLTEDKIEVKADGTVVIKDVDGKETIIPASSVVKEKTQTPGAPAAPRVEANDDGSVKVTPPTDADLESISIEYTDPQGSKKTVTATKNGDSWTFEPASSGFTIDASGNIVIPKDQVKPGTQVSAKAKNTGGKESTPGTAKVPSLADKYAPEYTEADGVVGTKSTITGPNFKDAQGQDAAKPANTTFELGQNAPEGAAVYANGTVTYTPTDADKGKTINIPVVVKYSDNSTETVNAIIKVAGENIQKPTAPTVVANEDGSVTVTPSNTDANTKKLEVTYVPTGQTDAVKVTATKDANGSWSLPNGVTDVSIDSDTGVITIQADKVADDTEVKAVAKDSTGVNTSDEAKATAKTPSTAPAEKPAAPKVVAKDDGSVEVTPPNDKDVDVVQITYTDENNHEGTLVATKGDDGQWKLPQGTDTSITIDPATGVVTIPADQVKDGSEVKAVAQKGTEVSDEAKENANNNLKKVVTKWVQQQADGTFILLKSEEGNKSDKDGVSDIPGYEFVRTDRNEDDTTITYTNVYKLLLGSKSVGLDGQELKAAAIGYNKENPDKFEGYTFLFDEAGNTPSDIEGKKVYVVSRIYAKNPEMVEVANPNFLTEDEQNKVKVAVKTANQDLLDNQISVNEKGEVTITRAGKTAELASDLTVVKQGQTAAPTVTAPKAGDKEIKGTAPAGAEVTVTLPDGTEVKATADGQGNWTATVPADKELAENDEIKVVAKDGDKEPSAEVKETVGPKASEEKPTAPDVKVKNNGDIAVTPPTDATEVTIRYTDPNGNLVSVVITKGTDGSWNIPAGSVLTKDSDGNIVIPANNVKPGTEVTATAKYPNGSEATGRVNTGINTEHPIYPGHDGYNGLPLWFFYGNTGSTTTTVEPKKEVKERGHHEEYMYGYPDGTFRPNANITRAEAAAMISRLKGYSLNDTTAPEFKDSKVGWFKAAINAVFKNGLMKGYKDGNFRPNDKITRAEFAQMVKNIDKSNSAVATFKDVKGHWAEDAINQAFGNGRISGYPDGTFRPDAPITRAEAVKIANSLFERSVDNSGLKEKLENQTMISKFTDVNNTHWAFYEIMEATNSHEFERREKGRVVEDWLEIEKSNRH